MWRMVTTVLILSLFSGGCLHSSNRPIDPDKSNIVFLSIGGDPARESSRFVLVLLRDSQGDPFMLLVAPGKASGAHIRQDSVWIFSRRIDVPHARHRVGVIAEDPFGVTLVGSESDFWELVWRLSMQPRTIVDSAIWKAEVEPNLIR